MNLPPAMQQSPVEPKVLNTADSSEEDSSDEGTFAKMDVSERERMLALLRSFSTPVNPSTITSSYIESLPNSRMHSGSNIHSCSNSNNNIHSCKTSSHTINIPPHLASNLHIGSTVSCATSANLTPLPVKKLRPPDSDSGTDLLNICRICHLPGDNDDVLFSPCRCSGSLKYVHYSCLLKWIEISTRKTKKPPKCELCQFMYIRHKRFKFHNWRLPRVSSRDKCLHTIFVLTLVVMITCAVATVLCFLSDNGQISQTKAQLSLEEVVTLTCGVLFFVSFFLAMTVEIKARHTVYRLFLKFIMHNTEWQIEPYEKIKDPDCPKPYSYNV